jgi:hypothetical protein
MGPGSLPAGRPIIRVISFGTGYELQIQEVGRRMVKIPTYGVTLKALTLLHDL